MVRNGPLGSSFPLQISNFPLQKIARLEFRCKFSPSRCKKNVAHFLKKMQRCEKTSKKVKSDFLQRELKFATGIPVAKIIAGPFGREKTMVFNTFFASEPLRKKKRPVASFCHFNKNSRCIFFEKKKIPLQKKVRSKKSTNSEAKSRSKKFLQREFRCKKNVKNHCFFPSKWPCTKICNGNFFTIFLTYFWQKIFFFL